MKPSDYIPGAPAYDRDLHLAHLRQLLEVYPLNTDLACSKFLVQACHDLIPHEIGPDILHPIHTLFFMENLAISEIDERDLHGLHEALLTPERIITARDAIMAFLQKLPIPHKGPFRLPLIDLTGRKALELVSYFLYENRATFPRTNAVLFDNTLLVNGYTRDKYKGQNLIRIWEAKGSPRTIIEEYLKDTPFLDILKVQVPYSFSQHARFEHHHVCAKSGHGKSTLYGVMLEEDLKLVAEGKASVIVMDSQADLIPNTLLRLKDFAPGGPHHDRLVYIDPEDVRHPIQLNILGKTVKRADSTADKIQRQAEVYQIFTFIFGAFRQQMTGRQDTLFRAVSALILEIDSPTIQTLNTLFSPPKKTARGETPANPLAPFSNALSRLDDDTRTFFEVDFHGSEFTETRTQIRARLQSLVLHPVFNPIFSATEQKLDLDHEMQRGAVILINTNKVFLRREGTEIFGRFFIALINNAANARANIPEKDRTPCFVYIDEAHEYIAKDENIAEILASARKYKVGMLLAHQNLSQIERPVQSALQGTTIKMVGNPNAEDVSTLASQLRTTPDFITAQPRYTFATYVANDLPSAVALTIPYAGVATAPKMTDAELQIVLAKNRQRYCKVAASAPSPAPPVEEIPTDPNERW